VQFKAAGQELKIEKLEIVTDDFTEFIPRVGKRTLTPPLSNRSTSPETRRSPMERPVLGQMASHIRGNSDQGEERSIPLPRSDINEMGLPKNLMTFLEVFFLKRHGADKTGC
jgi:hypothetical protein